MSKFDNVIAEAAYEITLHGFEEETYGKVDTTGWNALVQVSAVTLLNVGATDLSERFRQENGGDTVYAWIRENSEGFVTLVDHDPHAEPTGIEAIDNRFAEYVADMDKRAADEDADETRWEV